MPHQPSPILQQLYTKSANRPRYAIDPDTKNTIWCPHPGQMTDIKIQNQAHHISAIVAAETALQTDAAIAIATALERIADKLDEKDQTRCLT